MKIEQFREYLSIYGTNFEKWPREVASFAKNMYTQPPFSTAYQEEVEFEKNLDNSQVEPADKNLEYKIISKAKNLKSETSNKFNNIIFQFFWSIFEAKPVAVIVITLAFILGITNNNPSTKLSNIPNVSNVSTNQASSNSANKSSVKLHDLEEVEYSVYLALDEEEIF